MAATDTEILARLRLINTDGIGPVTFYKLLKTCRSAENALRSLPPKFHPAPLAAAEREISLARAKGIKILAFDNPEYPQKLRELEDAPPFLYVKGRTDILNRSPAVSVVGARNASINGRKLASRIAYDLTGAGVLIVSGMARGIDAASHKGAMYALEQNGPTVAVLGTGADIVYPAENFSLYEQIAAQGAVISEFPLGTEAQSGNFPRRNRIVSALADAVLVVEAGIHSGSLITARLALEQGRDVFAVPGSPVEARAAGPNKLIRDGAFLAEGAEDILNGLNLARCRKIKPPLPVAAEDLFAKPLDKVENNVDIPQQSDQTEKKPKVIDFLTAEGVYVDEIIRATGLEPAAVSLELLELEMAGRIERQVGNKVALIKRAKKDAI